MDRDVAGRRVLIAMAVGVSLRVLLVVTGHGTGRFLFADSDSYLVVARALPHALWSPGPGLLTATLWRTPVYPLFLWLAGGGNHLTAVVIVQCAIGGGLNVWLASRVGLRLFGPTAAVVAAVVCALDPVSVAQSLLVATETLTTTWLLLVVLGAVASIDRLADARPAWATAVGAGAAGAMLTLTRPNLILLAPFAALVVVLVERNRFGVRCGALLLVVAIVPVGAWVARNDHVSGTPVLTTIGGQNLVDFGLVSTAHDQGRLGFWTTDARRVAAAVAATPEAGRLSRPIDGDTQSISTDRAWRHEGSALVRAHPRGAATVLVSTTVKTALAPGTDLLVSHLPEGMRRAAHGPARAMGAVFLAALYVLAAGGAVCLVRRRQWGDLAITAGMIVLYVACSAGPWMDIRFRVPIVPVIAVLAGLGVQRLGERTRAVD